MFVHNQHNYRHRNVNLQRETPYVENGLHFEPERKQQLTVVLFSDLLVKLFQRL